MLNKIIILVLLSIVIVQNVSAELNSINTWTGNIGYSSDGFGSVSQSGVISANVPVGSTVIAAYLFTTLSDTQSTAGDGTKFNNTIVSFDSLIAIPFDYLAMRRADVTSIVKPIIDTGLGGIYNFNVEETHINQEGEALIVIYENSSLPVATFGLLEGYTATAGDTTTVSFSDPLDPTSPGFFAEMVLGIGFSYPDQSSTITVNGTIITENAGNYDDGEGSNGALITMGGFDDPFSTLLPTYTDDHERYNLQDYINVGDTSIVINTVNPSGDDIIFIAGFYVSGVGLVSAPGDDDNDGVDTGIEDNVPGVGNLFQQGDGNGDGILDSIQSEITSKNFTSEETSMWFTLGSSVGDGSNPTSNSSVSHAGALTNLLPEGIIMPYGQFTFTVSGVGNGDTIDLELFVPYNQNITGYYKWNNNTAQWDELSNVVVTHFQNNNKTKIAFSLLEGGPYDDDLLENGTLIDDGGPIVRATATATVAVPLSIFAKAIMAFLFTLGASFFMRRKEEA